MGREKLRVIQFGLGPIGCAMVRAVMERGEFEVVGGVDVAPDKVGKDLGEVAGLGRRIGVKVVPSVREALEGGSADVAIHCAGSFLDTVEEHFLELFSYGLNVVSTCEELSYPWFHHKEVAERIDEAARRHEVSILGTGVNPGFVMDLIPLVLSNASLKITGVYVERVVDAASRRGPLQRKIGAGLSVEEFEERARTGRFGHVGLVESVAMIADGLGLRLERTEQRLLPKILDREVRTEFANVTPGRVGGIDQEAVGIVDGNPLIRLKLQMYVGAREPHDTVELEGVPPLSLTIKGGTPGDVATVACTVNAIKRVAAAPPGLLTVHRLPVL